MKRSVKKYMRIFMAVILTLALSTQVFAGIKIESKAESTGYKEMKFSDWGTCVGSVNIGSADSPLMQNIYELTDSSALTSLDGVAISGKVNFNNTSGKWLTIGGTDGVKHGGFWLSSIGTNHWRIACQGVGGDAAAEIWNENVILNGGFTLRMTFDKVAETNTWTVNTYVNDANVNTTNFAGADPGLYISIAEEITVDMEPTEPDTYKEMKFSDWGTWVGSVNIGSTESPAIQNIYELTDGSALTSLDGVAISGTVNFNGASKKWLTIGGTDGAKHGGFWLGAVQENGWAMACQGIGTDYGDETKWKEGAKFTEAVEFRITFDKATDSDTWTVNVYADDVLVGTWTYEGVTPGLYISIAEEITVDMEPTEPITYKEMKFSDWSTLVRTEGDVVDLYALPEEKKLNSLDKVAISGMVNFGKAYEYISIAGPSTSYNSELNGINLRIASSQLEIAYAQANYEYFDKTVKVAEPFQLRMTFDRDVQKSAWVINVYVDGTHLGEKTYANATLGTALAKYKSITIYEKEMEFEDWGIPNGSRYDQPETYSLADSTQISSLDKVVVSGKMNFHGNSSYFRIGGLDYNNRHTGFQVGYIAGKGFALVPQGVTGADSTIHTIVAAADWAALSEQDIELRMCFDKKTDGNYYISIFIDGSYKGVFNCGPAQPGLYMANNGVDIYGAGGPDIYNPPTVMEGKTLSGTYITNVYKGATTTVISSADEDNGYISSTDYSAYGLDFVMDYNVNRAIKILQLTDTQIIDSAQCRTASRIGSGEKSAWCTDQMYNNLFRYIIKTVRDAKPDLILLTGDNIYGEFDDDGTSLTALINCMDSLKIPWAPIFGNHDNESEMGVEWQCEQFMNSPYCIFNRRNEIGGNGNYSIGIAKNGTLERVVYMMDTNGCYNRDAFDEAVVKRDFGFTDQQKAWYKTTAENVNSTAGKTIPSFLAYHVPTEEMGLAVVQAGYQATKDSVDTYTLGETIEAESVQPGDSGTKGDKTVYSYVESGLLEIMKAVGTDGAFFGHEHRNSLSVAYEGIRWTYGLKTGTYDTHPTVVGGTLITLSEGPNNEKFIVSQVQTDTMTMDAIYPRMSYTLPVAQNNPNYIPVDMTDNPDGYQVAFDDATIDGTSYSKDSYYNTVGAPILKYIDNGETIIKRLILYLKGDTNSDSQVNASDLVRIKKQIGGIKVPNENQASKYAADFNEDRKVTDTDAASLRKELVKKN